MTALNLLKDSYYRVIAIHNGIERLVSPVRTAKGALEYAAALNEPEQHITYVVDCPNGERLRPDQIARMLARTNQRINNLEQSA